MITEHYPTDVPRLTRIVDPPKHKGKLIKNVDCSRICEGIVIFVTDTGERIEHPNHITVRVEHGPERQAKMAWARSLLQ